MTAATQKVRAEEDAAFVRRIDALTFGVGRGATPTTIEPPVVARILVALTPGEMAGHAAKWARELVPLFGASFVVAQVTPLPVGPYSSYLYGAAPAAPPVPAIPAGPEARQALDALVRGLREAGASSVEARNLEGPAAAEVSRLAGAEDVDLVVVGSPSREGVVDRFLLGSLADSVNHHAPCDVLLAKTDPVPGDVAVSVDGSWASKHAALLALRIARAWGSTLRVHHVVEPPARAPEGDVESHARGLENRLGLPWTDVRGVEFRLHVGDPRETLVRVLSAQPPALALMGSRGLGALRSLVAGSVSSYVSHHIPSSLLLVKHPRGSARSMP